MDYDYLVKIILIGASAVGKSSIMLRYTDEVFTSNYISTIGVDFKIRTVVDEKSGKKVKLQIWDTAGQERFRTITNSYYRGAQVIILCFDLTNMATFLELDHWITDLNKYNTNGIRILVGNKSDLPQIVPQIDIDAFCHHRDLKYLATSAKLNNNIQTLFSQVTSMFVQHTNNLTTQSPRIVKNLNSQPVSTSSSYCASATAYC